MRDVVFGEDLSQVRTGSAPHLLAALRNLVIEMPRLGGVINMAAALRHYRWKPKEILTLIGIPTYNQKTLWRIASLLIAVPAHGIISS